MNTETQKPARWDNAHEQPKMFEWMTEAEWVRRYPEEYVLVIDPDWDDQKGLQAGYVAFHSPQREATYAEARRLNPKFCGCPFTGGLPEGMEFLL